MNHTKNLDFETFCKENLNPEQQKIVNEPSGILVVHAGAGSGKTRVITARIASLIKQQGNEPSSLLALTFTNKAAREMKERVAQFLQKSSPLPFLGTFHSYCLRLLKINRHMAELQDFTIMDDDDQQKLLKQILARHNVHKKITPRTISSTISRIKNDSISGSIKFEAIEDPIIRDICFAYEKEKTTSKCVDFDDLLLMTLRMFKKYPAFRESHQEEIRHLLVDEYQDTNGVQHALLKEMTLTDINTFGIDSLCMVGDEDQSIYSWRGAVAGTMINARQDYSGAQTFTLEQNYRSAQPILDVANNIIKHNTLRKPKSLWSAKEGSDRVRLLTCVSGYQESEVVAEFCKQYKKTKELDNCAILYRSHYQSRTTEEALIRNSIPYIIIGGVQFYDRLEIKDLLAHLKLVANPFDRISWTRTINTPSRGLGDKFQEQFIEAWDRNPFLNFLEISQKLIDDNSLVPSKKAALKAHCTLFEAHLENEPASVVLEHMIKKTDYASHLQNSYETQEANERIANIKELMNAMQSQEERGLANVREFLENLALLQEAMNSKEDDRNCVRLMTLHAAKGLEFDTVLLTGLEEGVLPSSHSLYDPDAIEEERRLLYVGVTRAQERLLLTHAKYRYTYGQMTDQRPSRFIKELTLSDHVTPTDGSQWAMPHVVSYCRQWLDSSYAIDYTVKPAPAAPTEPKNTFKAAKKETVPTTKLLNSKWKINQRVHHKKFGTGTVTAVETATNGDEHLTIKFSVGIKKISSKFVSP